MTGVDEWIALSMVFVCVFENTGPHRLACVEQGHTTIVMNAQIWQIASLRHR